MQLIFLDILKQISGYSDVRSVRSWLAGMKLTLVHIGKNYAVDRAAFEKCLARQSRIIAKKEGYTPQHKTEKDFLEEIDRLLSSDTEL